MATDWEQVKRLFHACVELASDDRIPYLDRECGGNEDLKREVLTLLAADEQTDSLLGGPVITGSTRLADGADLNAAVRSAADSSSSQIRVCPKCSGHFSSGELVCPRDGEVLVDDPEALVGTTIDGLYHVERFIKGGGFGYVYLAQHALLRDHVALKVLRRQLTSEPERLERFLREGRVARTLQHPNIVTVYDLRTSADGLTYMVQEFVDGPTLREECEQHGRLTPARAVELLGPVADALDEAHSQGIVHRDIKPENIMIADPDDKHVVKLLDLGIAKLREILAEPLEAAANVTQPGHVIGTPHYMSPEQWGDVPADGGPEIDARADVYSLGVVVYELVSGTTPFHGRNSSEIRRAHLVATPEPLHVVDPSVPRRFSATVSRALEKARSDRPASAGQFIGDLRAALDVKSATATTVIELVPEPAPRRAWRINAVRLVGAIVLLALTAGAVWAALHIGRTQRPQRFIVTDVRRVTFTGNAVDAAISPDGSQVVAAVEEQGTMSLYLCRVDGSGKVRITDPSDAWLSNVTFTHDSQSIYYCASESVGGTTIYKLPLPSGSPQPVVMAADSGVAISPTDESIAFIRRDESGKHADLMMANADGSGERSLWTTSTPLIFAQETPSWSPDGARIACSVSDTSNGYRGGIAEITVGDPSFRLITPLTWWYVDRVAWLPDGNALVASVASAALGDMELWSVAYPSGMASRITQDTSGYDGVTVARDGRMAAVQTAFHQSLWVSHAADGSDAHPITVGHDRILGASWTPDGRILYSSRRSGNFDVYVADDNGQNQRQLTFHAAVDRDPAMAPDNRTVYFASNRSGPFNIWRVDAEVAGVPEQITADVDDEYPAVSPDGRSLVYQGQTNKELGASIWRKALDGSGTVLLGGTYANWPAISPDGRWVVFTQQTEGDSHVRGAVMPLDGSSAAQAFDISILSIPRMNYQRIRWSADSHELLFIDDIDGVSQIRSMAPGGPARRVTSFPSDRIFTFDARNGALVTVRGTVTSDVVVVSTASAS